MNTKIKNNNLVCPLCGEKLSESFILSESARINGRKSRRKLTRKDAQKMQKKVKTMISEEASRIAKIRWDKK